MIRAFRLALLSYNSILKHQRVRLKYTMWETWLSKYFMILSLNEEE